jgi:hypothetical protein
MVGFACILSLLFLQLFNENIETINIDKLYPCCIAHAQNKKEKENRNSS